MGVCVRVYVWSHSGLRSTVNTNLVTSDQTQPVCNSYNPSYNRFLLIGSQIILSTNKCVFVIGNSYTVVHNLVWKRLVF